MEDRDSHLSIRLACQMEHWIPYIYIRPTCAGWGWDRLLLKQQPCFLVAVGEEVGQEVPTAKLRICKEVWAEGEERAAR